MLPIIKSVKPNDIVQLTDGNNYANSFLITMSDLKRSLDEMEVEEEHSHSEEESPDITWRKVQITSWLGEHDITWDEDDTKKMLLEKIRK